MANTKLETMAECTSAIAINGTTTTTTYQAGKPARRMSKSAALAIQAAKNGMPQRLQAQLNAGGDFDCPDEFGWTALHYAAKAGSSQCVRILIAASSDINSATGDQERLPPLSLTAAHGHTTTVQILASTEGIRLDQASASGDLALLRAAQYGHSSCIQVLLRAGANADAVNSSMISSRATALHAASSTGHWEVVDVLLNANATVCIRDRCGETALHLAAKVGHLNIACRLLQAGADTNMVDTFGNNAVHVAARQGHPSVVAKLLSVPGVIAHAKTESGESILHKAAFCRSLDTLQLILEHFHDVDAENNDGETPLHRAVLEPWPPWLAGGETLIDAGATVRASHISGVRKQQERISRGTGDGCEKDRYIQELDVIINHFRSRLQ